MNVYTVEISTEYSSKTTYDKFFIYRNFFTRSEAEKFIIEYLKSDDTELFDFITTYDSEIASILEIESDPSFGQIEIIIRTTSSNKTIDTDIHLAKLNNGIKDILKTDSDPNSIYQFMLDNCYEGVDEYTADGYITRSYFKAEGFSEKTNDSASAICSASGSRTPFSFKKRSSALARRDGCIFRSCATESTSR